MGCNGSISVIATTRRASSKTKSRRGPAYLFVGPGIHPMAVAAGFAAGKSGQELREHMNHGYEAARPSGWDPVERLKDQDLDGVVAEVLYSTLGIVLFNVKDHRTAARVPACL